MEVQLYAFLISTLHKGKWSPSPPRKERLVCIEQETFSQLLINVNFLIDIYLLTVFQNPYPGVRPMDKGTVKIKQFGYM